MGALETGKTLAEQILAKLPESLRGQVQTALLAPEATDALTLLGDSALARADYSREMDAIKKKTDDLATLEQTVREDYERNRTWWEQNSGKVKEFETIKPEFERLKAGGTTTTQTQPPTPTAGLTEEKVNEILAARDAGYARVLAVTTTLATKHFKDHGEVLDVNALVEHATKNRLPLYDPRADTDAYRALHGDKVTALAQKAEQERIDKLVAEKLALERKTQQQPFPVRGQEPSVLDSLDSPDRAARYTVDSAVARYEELTANAAGRS